MEVLVLSDSHGFSSFLNEAIKREPQCQKIFFLGDGVRDIVEMKRLYPDKEFIIVVGNNDYDSQYSTIAYKYLQGCTIVATHGHQFNVRRTKSELAAHAAGVLANVVFYGHTHTSDISFDSSSNVVMINPGAMLTGQYAVVTLENGDVTAKFKSIRDNSSAEEKK